MEFYKFNLRGKMVFGYKQKGKFDSQVQNDTHKILLMGYNVLSKRIFVAFEN